MEALDPHSKEPIYRFRVVSAAHGNAPSYAVTINKGGEPVESTPAIEALFDRSGFTTIPPGGPAGGPAGGPPVTITPNTNTLTLNPGDTLDETITVFIPKNAGPVKADVYFLADTTGSMSSILAAVQTGANSILTAPQFAGLDIVFGVGNYKDFNASDPFAFQHQVNATNVAASVTAGITAWSASGGNDVPEADLFALKSVAEAPGGPIGWRAGSKRIVVWFGDAPGHDPVCTAVSGKPAVTEASATANLVAQSITVLAISTATPGLDDDPKSGSLDYAACGAPGGLPGQGTRIATATGGVFVTGINAGNIVNTIISLVSAAVGAINNGNLVPSPSIAPFITSITPPGGYGPLPGDKDQTLTFDVKFHGVPCKVTQQVITGTIDVVADGVVVATKKVQITVPPCAPRLVVYSVKFVCGVQPECECQCTPVEPGAYATEINIHNFSQKEIPIVKRFIPLVLAGAPVGREPRTAGPRAEDKIVLPPHTATMDDCCRIAELIYGAPGAASAALTIGILEIIAPAELAVTAVYTTSGLKSCTVSIAVEQITPQRQ